MLQAKSNIFLSSSLAETYNLFEGKGQYSRPTEFKKPTKLNSSVPISRTFGPCSVGNCLELLLTVVTICTVEIVSFPKTETPSVYPSKTLLPFSFETTFGLYRIYCAHLLWDCQEANTKSCETFLEEHILCEYSQFSPLRLLFFFRFFFFHICNFFGFS